MLAAVALVVGIPLGFVVGRVVWAAVADGIGVATEISVPILALIGMALSGADRRQRHRRDRRRRGAPRPNRPAVLAVE